MKHVLITGGAGFIGSHLCDVLLAKGYAVTALDNLVTGQKSNLEEASRHPHFSFVQRDVSLPFDESHISLIAKHGLFGILHFACPASPVDFERIPIEILKVDSLGTMHTVDLALKFKCRYLLASTSEIYGDPLVHPQPETYWGNVNTLGPRACYDETKRFAEAYVSTSIQKSGLNGGMVRIFNTYGPRMRLDDGRIVPELCRQALKGEPLTLHGDGLQTRSFCYVSDLVEGILRLFLSSISAPINIGNPQETSVLDFAKVIQVLTKTKSQIEYLPARPDDPRRRCPDITNARGKLGWGPQVQLEQGLKLTLKYFQSLMA